MGLLSECFFVEGDPRPGLPAARPASTATVYEIAGTRANVEMAAHVYAFLLATADRLWRENRGDARVRSGRDRLAYQSGVIRGFRDKLLAERTELARHRPRLGRRRAARPLLSRAPPADHDAQPHASASTAPTPPGARPAARSCCTSR